MFQKEFKENFDEWLNEEDLFNLFFASTNSNNASN
jgi:hypothetical protein